MNYSQATIAKINKDIVLYHNNEKDAKKSAKRMSKDADYSAVWYGNEGFRTQVK